MAISTSSLLNSAAARRNKIQEQEDSLVAFEYSLSAKTYDDFVAYSTYLNNRASKSNDASKMLTYQKAIVGARKGYISNEIQRQNIAVVEGRTDNRGKYGKMVDLYYQAIENNDYDLAQSLNLQLDNLSVKIQMEDQAKAEAGQRVASTLAANGVKDLKSLAKKIKEGEEIITLGDGTLVKPVKAINNELRNTGQAENYFADLFSTTKALQDLVANAYNAATDQDTVDKLESSFKGLIDGTETFAAAVGNDGKEKKLSMQDIELAYRSAAANNPIYSLESRLDAKTGRQAFGLKENKIDDFVWTRNDDGSYSATQARATNKPSYQRLSTQITNEGYVIGEGGNINQGKTDSRGNFVPGKARGDDSMSIGNRLKSLGIIAKENEDGTLELVIPGVGQTKGTIMPDGSIRYFGAPGQFSGEAAGLYELNLLADGKTREVAPDEASDFGNQSVFGGLLSQPSERGKNYIQKLAGLSPVESVSPVDLRRANINEIGAQPLLQAPGGISTALDFSGKANPVTSRLLQGASFTQGNMLKEAQERLRQAAEAENARLQQTISANALNQTPVAQFASNGAPIRQLSVARPVAQPRITVAPAPKTTQQKAQSLTRYAVPAGNLLQGFR